VDSSLSRERARAILLGLLLVGGFFRFQGLAWDDGHHLHPDERFISMVEEKIAFPRSTAAYFDSLHSSLNPYNKGEGSFVYGSLPMVLAKAIGPLFGRRGYDGTYLIGRALSGIFDLLTVWIVYRITRRLAQRRASLVAAGLMAFCVLGIQLSHFWAVDTYLTTFSAAALLGCLRIAQGRSRTSDEILTGVALGLAVACKITALALLLPLGVAILVRMGRDGAPWTRTLLAAIGRGLRLIVPAAIVVRVFLPYVFLGPSPLSFRLDPRWVEDLRRISQLSKSVAGFPPALQWAGRTIVFPVENFVLWGAGVAFGLTAIAAVIWAVGAILRRKALDLLPLVSYALFLFAYHGFTLVKSIRYFYPAYPALAALAGALVSAMITRGGWPRTVRAFAVALVGATFLWALAFTAIYRRPQTRVAATKWIYEHVPPREPIVNESWDDGLPLPLPGYDPSVYAGPQALPLFDPDSREKAELLIRALHETKWVAVTSNRVYANVTRVPTVFPMSIAYYRALFDGSLGFERAADFTSYPSLGPIRIPDDRAEEQFTVYDHPRVLIFRKTARFSKDAVRQLLLAAIPQTPPTMNDWEQFPRSLRTVSEPVRPDHRPGADRSPTVEPAEPAGGSVSAAILWYLALGAVGLVAWPLVWTIFPRLGDRGFGLARIVGLVLLTYALTAGITLHVFANGRRAALTCLAALAVVSAWAAWRDRHDLARFFREHRRALIQSEIVFAAGFLLFLGIRAFNPEIYWGEKPMDFSILNILVRAPSLPASDPWFAGAPLGYYTFGQEMVVFLTFLTHLSTRYTFNLAFGFLGGVILQGAFSLGRNWGGRLRAGAAAASLTLLLGNLSGLREWLLRKRALDWDYFWATSRVIKDTINEYPFWSLTFADLHAHVLAIPIFLAFTAAALHLVRLHMAPSASRGARIGGAVLFGFLGAAQALTNAWDVPLLAGLLVVTALAVSLAGETTPLASIGRGLAAFAVSAGSAYVLARPFWVRAGGAPGLGKNGEPPASGADLFTVFGFFFYLAAAWWIAAVSERVGERGVGRGVRRVVVAVAAVAFAAALLLKPAAFLGAGIVLFVVAFFALPETREDRLAFGYLGTAFFLVLFCQRLYIYDRMNTFFKLYLEAWLLFAIATSVLVFRRAKRGVVDRWVVPARLLTALFAAAALFTSVTAGRAAISRHFAPYSGPSLDGLRYLETLHPGEARAVAWLRRSVSGTPVILEAQGPSYQDFSRISMLTGLPTVLGWDYHVKQRGNPEAEIEKRRQAVRAMYSEPEAERVAPLLARYRVGYVYVGWLERRTYPAAGLLKFKTNRELFETVYENPEAQIYRVVGGPTQDVILPSREALPEASGAPAPPEDEPEEKPAIAGKAEGGEPPYSNLREPRGAAVDGESRLWVADFGHSRLRVFDADGGFLGGWGGRGGGEYGFKELCGVAIRGEDLYVADTWNGRVQAFTTAGLLRASAGELYGPRGVAVAPDGRVWVSDTGNHRVVSYDGLLQDRRFYGKRGKEPGEFTSPVGISVAPSGTVVVADAGNQRIQILGKDGSPRGAFPFPGWAGNAEPGLVVDVDGSIYATDPNANSVVVLDSSGAVKRKIELDETGNKLAAPTGIAIDRKTRILYVVNSGNASISKIRLDERRAP
jgi:YYY domain-containing protein